MKTPFTVSLELLAVDNKTFLALELLGLMETIKKKINENTDYTSEIEKIPAIIKRNTGIQIRWVLCKTHEIIAGVRMPLIYDSASSVNSGSHGEFVRELLVIFGDVGDLRINKKQVNGKVDLVNVRVSGVFSKVEHILHFSTGLFEHLTADEVTAILLHEIGHVFTSIATFGNFVWMNYLLTDGIDILLGKKKNEYKINYLNEKVPDEKKARVKVTSEIMLRYRESHNPFVTLGTYKRGEQVADQFVARLGFGRPLVTALDKFNKNSINKYTDFSGLNWYRVLKQLGSVVGLTAMGILFPITWWYIAFGFQTPPPDIYDRPKDRAIRIKRDLIIQLKNIPKNTEISEIIIADIKAIDDVLIKMDEWKSWMETTIELIDPVRRRSNDRFKLEKQLESLLANDLFVTSAKFKTLTKV